MVHLCEHDGKEEHINQVMIRKKWGIGGRVFEVISLDGDSQDDDELGVGVVDELGEGKGAKSCEDSKKLRLLSRVHLVDNMNKMVVEKMTTIKHS